MSRLTEYTGAVTLLILFTMCSPTCAFEWRSAPPETEGLSPSRLEAMAEGLKKRGTNALLVIRNDHVVGEWYAPGFSREKPHYTASLAKAIVGGVSLMLAIDDGRMSPDDLASKYVPAWRDDPLKSKITVRQLATHYSGIEDAEQDGLPHDKLPGWKGAFWRQDPNPFLTARDEAPVLWEPGTEAHYSNPGMAMLSYCVTVALEGAPEQDIRALLRRRIMEPLGVPAEEWSMGYGKTHTLDGLPLCANWGGGGYSPNAVARIGRLMLRGGDWDGQRLVSEEAVRLVIADAGMPAPRGAERTDRRSGLCWWLNSNAAFPKVPRDMFAGSGAGHQLLIVIPSLDMVVVRNGAALSPAGSWDGVVEYLLNPLMAAVTTPPYPPSHAIAKVEFAPVDEIRREAIGSDNWPITWGDDDAQYTSYGDGWGFDPRTESKLSLGLARIVGSPEAPAGENLRSATAERIGDGKDGPKASGMLMVDGVLYMLVRNVGNSQLAWSEDRGKTWEWGLKFTESFGCPTFLNAGRNYADAPDGFVYVYSCDGPGAYDSYDRMVLARVPRQSIRDGDAYEYLASVDEQGDPVWTADIAGRGAVFAYPGHCSRSDIVFVPAIQRYLMALGFNHQGGWGLFDAPNPWGPWTTAYHTNAWGLGETHGYRLPAKWISADGRILSLVFSGRDHDGVDYDAFCIRRMSLRLFDSLRNESPADDVNEVPAQ